MKGSILALALVALVSLMGISGSLPFSAVSFAQPQGVQPQPHGSPSNVLNNVINNAINGVSTALSHVPKGTPAYSLLSQSLSYLQRAQKLASEGNMSGAQFYFNLAMEKSYKGVNEVNSGEGQPVPPGLNVSRAVQLAFADKLENELRAVNNATLKGEAQALIQSAVQLLNSPQFNASALVQARHELNNASFIINTDAEHRLFRAMGIMPFKDRKSVV